LRRSSRNWPASSQRAWATAPAGETAARTRVAWPAVISLLKLPGTSSHNTACSRQAT
jgi:hypothetical protein